MTDLTLKSKQVSTWHIDQIYLESIWGRIDVYNKGMESSTNKKYSDQIPTIKECWTLLKNVYDDFSPYIKNFKTEYDKLYKLRNFLWSQVPRDQALYTKWVDTFKQVVFDLDERKRMIILALANKQSLLTHKIEYSELDKIKRVMRDE